MSDYPQMPPTTDGLHPSTKQRVRAVHLGLSLDGWAVLAALVLGVIVYFGVKVPW